MLIMTLTRSLTMTRYRSCLQLPLSFFELLKLPSIVHYDVYCTPSTDCPCSMFEMKIPWSLWIQHT
ncbi:hypothetical protein K443DRAFT_542091 [Laccaria amethystina LaAM-08-1]|uniref:Uncharacterized protein n=1 Tax=Laccaria amethystina LaAM-08-1 TaxID=1095629 RepID=A0A0C9Y1X2_9AGAR|nr:hypothetical protein K443DRAFT_542091 [Laccaria amethystina LaAM-08-1]